MRQQVQLAGDFQDGVTWENGRSGFVPPGVVQTEALGTGNRGDPHDVKERQLPDGGSRQRPHTQLCCLAESNSAPAKARPEAKAQAEDGNQKDGSLRHHTESGETGNQECLGGSPIVQSVGGVVDVLAKNPNEHPQAGDGHQVVEDGSPHGGPERSVGVQHLREERVEPVKEDLGGQAPESEGDRQRLLLLGIALGGEVDDQGCRKCYQRRQRQQHQDCECQQAADVVRAAVRGGLAGLDDLRDQDGIEHAACYQQEDQVRQVVRVNERVIDRGAQAEGGTEHPRFGEAKEPGNQRSCCHDGAGTCFSGLNGLGCFGFRHRLYRPMYPGQRCSGSTSRAKSAMRRSFGKDNFRASSWMGTHAASTASWSGSFSMVSSPPVARSRKWCTVLWTRWPLTVNQ